MKRILYSLTIVLAIVAIIGSGCAKSGGLEQDFSDIQKAAVFKTV